MLTGSSSPAFVVRLPEALLRDPERALATEWLETDGQGGFAASTPWMCPTRRYHGLLVQRPSASAPRHLFLSRFEEELFHGAERIGFSCARYGQSFSPAGQAHLQSFELRPYPRASYRLAGLELTREVLLSKSTGAILLRYRVSGDCAGAQLSLRPLFACRPADALTFVNEALDPSVEVDSRGLLFRPYAALPAVAITVGTTGWQLLREQAWFRGQSYAQDARRGYDSVEDQFCVGRCLFPLTDGAEIVVGARLREHVEDPRALFEREASARRERASRAGSSPRGRLALAAEDFLYRAPGGRLGVQAGYPWFEEWGRDTFVALPGLTLARGELEACASVLSGALPFLRDGLLPNIFAASAEESAYDSADAALWFARAVGLYRRSGGARERLCEEYRPALETIAASYRAGTQLGLRQTDEGLLWAGSAQRNATWMDARTAEGPVTPRAGCAVELNALWYGLLSELETLRHLAVDTRGERAARAERELAGRAFLARMWLEDEGRLADSWDGVRADKSLRPNMVIAAALEASPLSRAQRASIVAAAERELLTPRGLRTLSPRDPAYRGRYEGGPMERDRAYHQGTAWPWLTAFYVEAALRGAQDPRRASVELGRLWDELVAELDRAGLGHVSEVFDGDEPQRPGGTFAQAWNTGELLRMHALLAEASR